MDLAMLLTYADLCTFPINVAGKYHAKLFFLSVTINIETCSGERIGKGREKRWTEKEKAGKMLVSVKSLHWAFYISHKLDKSLVTFVIYISKELYQEHTPRWQKYESFGGRNSDKMERQTAEVGKKCFVPWLQSDTWEKGGWAGRTTVHEKS